MVAADEMADDEALQRLCVWLDRIPLSRPKRNLSRDFSDGVLVAEMVKFYFPRLVEMHNYVPANSLQQKLNNWGHLNRKVLSKLNFSVPKDVIQKIAQCTPGVVELVLIPLRQRLEEKQKRKKPATGPSQDLQLVPDNNNYLDVGFSQKPKDARSGPGIPDLLGAEQREGGILPGYSQALQGDSSFILQMAEKDEALLACQEMVQVLQMKVRRLEHLLELKNVRIQDLTRRLQRAESRPC
ncbi:sperm flagellar protein 1 [Ornithorhynchus anatinus]|uniref:Sperm flagellar protein 1 n=1 Tax=Ornithorhynchus anatinus TaxID=9258 RepID=A0A6I8NB03_ORNAN|nr:sperm flagellar protein 1 [Ornithorhynchus anatinus]